MQSAIQEIWYKGQRVLRTIVQVAIPAFFTFNIVLPQIIVALGGLFPAEAYLWMNAVAAGITAVSGALAKIMAIPTINQWLVKLNLASVPKSEVEALPEA